MKKVAGLWRAYSLKETDDEVRAAFRKRFDREPLYVVENGTMKLAGPLRPDEAYRTGIEIVGEVEVE